MKHAQDEEQVYECEKCNMMFKGKSDLKGHVYRYHEEVTRYRFYLFKQCLAEVLEHMSQHCEEDTSKSDKKFVNEKLLHSHLKKHETEKFEYLRREAYNESEKRFKCKLNTSSSII